MLIHSTLCIILLFNTRALLVDTDILKLVESIEKKISFMALFLKKL